MRKKLFIFFQKLGKRKRFVIATVLVLLINLLLTLKPFSFAIILTPLLVVFIYGITYFALLEDIEHIEWIALFILPVFFAISFLLFYYLLPIRWLTRVPFLVVLSVGMYAIFLSENIFNVGVFKTLPLYRAAYSIANFITLLVLLFFFTVLYSFRQHFLLNAFFGGVFSWPLFFQGIWSASPRAVLEERVYKYASILSILLSCAILILNFLPIKTSVYAIYTVAIAYVLIGLTQEIIQDTAFRERIRAYAVVFLITTALVFLTTRWGG